jgi:tight adherence protein B
MTATTSAGLVAATAAAASVLLMSRAPVSLPGPGPLRLTAGVAALLLGVAAAGVLARSTLPIGIGVALVGAVAAGMLRLHRVRRSAAETTGRVLEACGVLAAELAAGRPPGEALRQAAAEWDHLAPAAEAATLGADVPAALRSLASAPGARDLSLVAAAWQVAHDTGQGLSAALGLVVEDLRSLRETRRVITSELASARATARLVSLLPPAALAMGRGAGGDPLDFLLHHPLGWACGATGLLLLAAGLGWIEALAGSAESEG